MKAIVWTNYGSPDVLELQEVEKPTPKENELLIKVHAATAFAGDCELRRLDLPLVIRLPLRIYAGLIKPKRVKVLGQELSGEVVSVGSDVKNFKVGDNVFGSTGFRFGAYADFARLPDSFAIALKPENISYSEAAAIPVGGSEALHYLKKGKIQTGESILVNGAGGSIGTFVVQLAKYYGAVVTAVDHTSKLDMLRSIGADHVIDYTQEDFAARSEKYDLIFDSVGKNSFDRCVNSLKSNGRYLLASPNPRTRRRGRQLERRTKMQVIIESVEPTKENLAFLANLISEGILKVVIDREFSLADTAEAHRYVETGQKKGHVIITV